MATYSITLNIGAAGVTQINTNLGQFVTLVKSVKPTPAPGKPIVAWVATAAMDTMVISWEEDYYVYAYEELVSVGDTITGFSQSDMATVGQKYTYSAGNFDAGTPGDPGTYGAVNQSGGNITMGLAQMVSTGGTPSASPINAVTVGNTEEADFTPEVIVSVFLQGYSNNGVVISEITGNACTVTLTSAAPNATLAFNVSDNVFTQTS